MSGTLILTRLITMGSVGLKSILTCALPSLLLHFFFFFYIALHQTSTAHTQTTSRRYHKPPPQVSQFKLNPIEPKILKFAIATTWTSSDFLLSHLWLLSLNRTTMVKNFPSSHSSLSVHLSVLNFVTSWCWIFNLRIPEFGFAMFVGLSFRCWWVWVTILDRRSMLVGLDFWFWLWLWFKAWAVMEVGLYGCWCGYGWWLDFVWLLVVMMANSTGFAVVGGDGVGFRFVVLADGARCGFHLLLIESRG